MRSNSSKPSSDAGFRAIGDFSSIAAATAQTSPESLGCSRSFTDRHTALANQLSHLTGRHKAPTGVPTSTQVLVGGEGTPSREVLANHGGIRPQGVALPSLHFRFVANCDGTSVVSFLKDREGIFLYVWPFELALLRPGVQS